MAEYLTRVLDGLLAGAMATLTALAVSTVVHAQGLPDPTRPPAIIESAGEQNASVASSGPVLQSVLISPTRRIATINGQVLKPGDKFGEARVMKITENEVVLRNGQEMQTLKLFPQVEKQTASNQKHAKAGSRQRSR
jgi:MSHA biogenesis protein MshK